jgi:hypothetical protein
MDSFGFTNSIKYVKEIFNYYSGVNDHHKDNNINPNQCNICFKDIKKCNYVSSFWLTTIGHVHIENDENGKDNVYQCNGSKCNSCKIHICYTCAKQCRDCNRFLCVKCVKYIYIETEKNIKDNISNISLDLDYWDKEYETSFIPKCQNNCLYCHVNNDDNQE